MKMTTVATGVIIAFLSNGSVFATATPDPGYEKWQSDHAQMLCTDHGVQFKDAVRARGEKRIPISAQRVARLGEAICHFGNYANGDRELTKALAQLHLSPSAGAVDRAD